MGSVNLLLVAAMTAAAWAKPPASGDGDIIHFPQDAVLLGTRDAAVTPLYEHLNLSWNRMAVERHF
jgi:hypothetical protein